MADDKAVYPAQEAMYAFQPGFLPVKIAVRRRSEERIYAGGIGAVAGHHVVGRNHVALALRHRSAIFDHHALGKQAEHGLVVLHDADVAHELGPETRITKMQDAVFATADVRVAPTPVI